MSPTIVSAHAREILDSRGRPTVEAELRAAGVSSWRVGRVEAGEPAVALV